MNKRGHEISMSRKLDIVRTVLNKSKGVSILHGERLVNHVASSIKLYEKYNDELEIKELVLQMGWDYDRMSSSGQDTYNKLCNILNLK